MESNDSLIMTIGKIIILTMQTIRTVYDKAIDLSFRGKLFLNLCLDKFNLKMKIIGIKFTKSRIGMTNI